jgi:hypothetical protein
MFFVALLHKLRLGGASAEVLQVRSFKKLMAGDPLENRSLTGSAPFRFVFSVSSEKSV